MLTLTGLSAKAFTIAAEAALFTEAYCLPQEAMNALDTAKFWTGIVAGSFAVVALILVGIGMFFSGRRGDGGEMLTKLGWWIGGAVLISAATGIASIFIQVPQNCIPIG